MLLSPTGMPLPSPGSLADETPSSLRGDFRASGGISLSSSYASYAALYKQQLWVYVLTRKLGMATARLRLKTFSRDADGGRADASSSNLGQLLANPNPRHSPFFLWLWTQTTRALYGEAIWLKIRGDATGRVRELWPMHPSNIITRRDSGGMLWYVYAPGAMLATGMVAVPESEVVHFRDYNPADMVRGLSPLEPLRQTLLAEDASRRSVDALYKNAARPHMALATDQVLSDASFRRLTESWDATHGGVDSWNKTAIFEAGVKPTPLQLSPVETEYISVRQLNREECCAAYDIPPPVVHILDRATFSNITEQMRSMYRDTMSPILGLLEAELHHQLVIPDFAVEGSLFCAFSLDDVLRGSYEVRTAAKAQAIGTGQLTANEARRDENLADLPGGDVLLVNAALIPLHMTEEISHGTGTDLEEVPQKIKSVPGPVIFAATRGLGLVAAGTHTVPEQAVRTARRLVKGGEVDTGFASRLLASTKALDGLAEVPVDDDEITDEQAAWLLLGGAEGKRWALAMTERETADATGA